MHAVSSRGLWGFSQKKVYFCKSTTPQTFSTFDPVRLLLALSCLLALTIGLASSFLVEGGVDRDPWDRRSVAGPDVDLLRALGQGQDLCPSSAAIRDLCQRCSKMTKDPKAFRMCCTNSKDARTWCASFLDFGLN
ncbi:secreted protein, putative [Ixodes scapularis]|uniref:Secreted protein, putative n=1 Tax=Ixodes scapularis TaxID=6945 RepID=B7P9U2_IXOSC|nr:secreted protein, putative [Ixodes scapularis]|eukprot:XP_002405405.1 secreted protein, putative [Ixodes scapularis]